MYDPADGGVYEALVRHFTDYAVAFIARCSHPDLPDANHNVVAQFVAHGFTGAIKAWLSDNWVTKRDLVNAAAACAPVWWSWGTVASSRGWRRAPDRGIRVFPASFPVVLDQSGVRLPVRPRAAWPVPHPSMIRRLRLPLM